MDSRPLHPNPADVLVSYSSADKKVVAQLVGSLEAAGYRVWWDNELRAGEEISAKIESQIRSVSVVLVLWSHTAKSSKWVAAEAKLASELGKAISLRLRDFPARDVPIPHNIERIEVIDELPNLFLALESRGLRRRSLRTSTDPDGRITIAAPSVHNSHGQRFLPGAGKVEWFRDARFGPEMVVVPASDPPAPILHHLSVPRPVAVGKFAITFDDWEAALADGGVSHLPHDENWGRGSRPVINVSWHAAEEYIKWLRLATGQPSYRFPTEVEWEYCCRAGKSTRYSTGDTITHDRANFSDSIVSHSGRTIEVGALKSPNEFGIHDMHGNVWEWCQDAWFLDDSAAPSSGSKQPSFRIARGGSWNSIADDICCTSRQAFTAANGKPFVGFRVVRDV
jgi:formylglycine-generating enzyme required for sulfatase activity